MSISWCLVGLAGRTRNFAWGKLGTSSEVFLRVADATATHEGLLLAGYVEVQEGTCACVELLEFWVVPEAHISWEASLPCCNVNRGNFGRTELQYAAPHAISKPYMYLTMPPRIQIEFHKAEMNVPRRFFLPGTWMVPSPN